MLRNVAQKRGIKNTFSFVGRYLPQYAPLIHQLQSTGADVALHDVVHDNRIAFLPEEAIIERLSPTMEHVHRYNLTGFRSPSWYTSPALWSALGALGFLYDMSALDTWPFFSPKRNFGVCTFFPYMVGSLVVIPNTIPFETPWCCGYAVRHTLDFWKPKFDHVARSGGLIMFNAHPDRWYCGNRPAIEQLERCLDYILTTHDPATMTAAEAATHTLQMHRTGRTTELPGVPSISVPRHDTDPNLPAQATCRPNPCAVRPREFLRSSTRGDGHRSLPRPGGSNDVR